MKPALPPLNAIRVFEAASRLLSFTQAANELHVTQAAVSHQIKHLEDYLNLKLFRRINRRLLLTEEGQIYAPTIRESLQQLAAATERLTASRRIDSITVSVLPSFASRWLVPRLWKFRQLHPELDVRLSAFEWVVDFERDAVDLAIRYGKGCWSGTRAELLIEEKVFPVCSPKLLRGEAPLKTPADLRDHTLLHDNFAREGWKQWLAAAQVEGIDPGRGPSFSHAAIVLDAAEAGQGVALGQGPLVADDLARGRLVKPFALELDAEYSYYVVIPEGDQERPNVAAFKAWLLAEMDQFKSARLE